MLFSPYLSTALLPSLKPSPYAAEVSDSIWCLKNSPSFFSKSDLLPFFEEDDAVDEEEADDEDEDEAKAAFPPEPAIISVSNHM